MVARLPIQVRRNTVFDLVVAGSSHADIVRQLKVSEDTVARDMAAISDEVTALTRERAGEVLAVAVANIQAVIDAAWSDYTLEQRRERDWLAGKLDYATLETKIGGVGAGDVDEDAIDVAATQALGVVEKRSSRRPSWRSNKAKYLDIVLAATRELCELVGLKKVILEHQGKIGVEVDSPAMSAAAQELTEWRRLMSEQLLSMQSASPMPPIS
jgi:hypothetical protein